MNAWIEPALTLAQGVRVLTTLRSGLGESVAPFDQLNLGLRSGDNPETVQRNRDALAQALALPAHPHWLTQVHGTGVAVIRSERPSTGLEPTADAAVTSVRGAVIGVLTADCLPVAFIAKTGEELGVAHAGWRGLAAGVLERTLAAMQTSPDQLMAWMGPAAGPCIYEIGEEVRTAFVSEDPRADAFFHPTRPGHWRVDLYGLARARLQGAGVKDISGGEHCTISAPAQFFSHRRDARTGRMATLAWMEPVK